MAGAGREVARRRQCLQSLAQHASAPGTLRPHGAPHAASRPPFPQDACHPSARVRCAAVARTIPHDWPSAWQGCGLPSGRGPGFFAAGDVQEGQQWLMIMGC